MLHTAFAVAYSPRSQAAKPAWTVGNTSTFCRATTGSAIASDMKHLQRIQENHRTGRTVRPTQGLRDNRRMVGLL